MRKNEADSNLRALTQVIEGYEKTFRLKIEALENKVVRFTFDDLWATIDCAYDNQRMVGELISSGSAAGGGPSRHDRRHRGAV
jgi:hypothetical protein